MQGVRQAVQEIRSQQLQSAGLQSQPGNGPQSHQPQRVMLGMQRHPLQLATHAAESSLVQGRGGHCGLSEGGHLGSSEVRQQGRIEVGGPSVRVQ